MAWKMGLVVCQLEIRKSDRGANQIALITDTQKRSNVSINDVTF